MVQKASFGGTIREGLLSNGIRLVTQSRKTEAVAFHIYFGCGGRHEPDEVVGVSHALEHMIFKGTPSRTHLQIAQEMEGVGATINANTGSERTCYHFLAPAEVFPQVLGVYADAVNHSLLDDAEWGKERQVILEELKMYEDMLRIWVSDRLETLMYNLQIGVIGDRKTIQTIETRHMRELMERWYRPENAVISVAGQVEHDSILDLAEKAFGDRWKKSPLPPVPKLPEKSRDRLCCMVRQTDQVNLAIGFRAYGRTHSRLPALRLLNDILGGKMSSRLFAEVREKRGLAYGVGSRVHSFTDGGFVELKAGVALENAVEATRVILSEAAKLCQELVTEEELMAAKHHLRGLILVEEDSAGFAARNGESLLLEGKVRSVEQELAEFERVEAEELQQVAQEVFRDEELTAVFIADKDMAEDLTPVLRV